MYEQFSPPPNLVVGDRVPDGQVWRRAAVVIDGPSAGTSDIPQALPIKASIVLVVVEGAGLNRVRDAAEQFLPGELDGIVFVRRSSRWPWMRSPAAPVRSSNPEAIDQWIESRQTKSAGSTEVAPERKEISLEQPGGAYESGRVISGAEFRND